MPIAVDGLKVCSNPNCKQSNPQPLDNFYKDKRRRDGQTPRCKSCMAQAQKAYLQTEHGKEISRIAQRRHRQTKKGRSYIEAYRKSERRKEVSRKYRASEKGKAAGRRHAKKFGQSEAGKAYRRSYRSSPEGKNRERTYIHRRLAQKAASPGDFTPEEFKALCDYYGNRCLACGVHSDQSPLTADHIVPLKKGGVNTIANIQPLCMTCNGSKGHWHFTDYRLQQSLPLPDFVLKHATFRSITWEQGSVLQLAPKKAKKRSDAKSTTLKGVYQSSNKFFAEITIKGTKIALPRYGTEEEAGRAYDAYARKFNRAHLGLNFPDEYHSPDEYPITNKAIQQRYLALLG